MADKNVLLKDGENTLYPKTKAELVEGLSSKIDDATVVKVDIAQGVAHAGEFLVVGNDGNVTTVTMQQWTGGNY